MTDKSTNFEGQTSHEEGKSPILLIFMSNSPCIFGHLEFRHLFCLNFLLISIKSLVMEPVGHDGRNNPFQGQTSREAGTLNFVDFVYYSIWIFGD